MHTKALNQRKRLRQQRLWLFRRRNYNSSCSRNSRSPTCLVHLQNYLLFEKTSLQAVMDLQADSCKLLLETAPNNGKACFCETKALFTQRSSTPRQLWRCSGSCAAAGALAPAAAAVPLACAPSGDSMDETHWWRLHFQVFAGWSSVLFKLTFLFLLYPVRPWTWLHCKGVGTLPCAWYSTMSAAQEESMLKKNTHVLQVGTPFLSICC